MRVEELDTPALIVDLDALETNLDRYQRYYDQHRIGLRPHIKTHKTIEITRMQLARGAVGITCQKLGEAEAMVDGGIDTDILIPYNLIGAQKLRRLATLARRVRVSVAVDSEYTVRGLSEALAAAGVSVGVLIEVETGAGRTGATAPDAAAVLGRLVDRLPGLELRGIMGFPTPPAARPLLAETLAQFDRAGLPHPVVSGGSTKSALQAHELPELTEYRAGEYPVGGVGHLREGRHTVEQCALRVLMTVVSRPTDGRAILDGGTKTLSASVLRGADGDSLGHLVEYPAARFYGASEEHGHVDVSGCERKPAIGELVQVIPVHPCPCVNEHDELVAIRRGRVEATWRIAGRGRIK
jgi:D-serine deaminase-like pyridoxal phosphate-dependent protein